MIESIVRSLQKIKAIHSVLPRDWERDAILETYNEVQAYGLRQAIADATLRYNDPEEVAQLFAYLMIKAQDVYPLPEFAHYRAIGEAAKDSKEFLSCLAPKKRTWGYDPKFPKTEEGRAAMLGYILTTWYPDSAIDKMGRVSESSEAIIQALTLLDAPETKSRHWAIISSLRNYFEENELVTTEAHLNLRRVSFDGSLTNNSESFNSLTKVVTMLAGLKQFDTAKLQAALDKININENYKKGFFDQDFFYVLNGLDAVEDNSLKDISSDAPACYSLFREFLIKLGKDDIALSWCLIRKLPASHTELTSSRYPSDRNYAARDFVSVLCDGDDFGGYDCPEGRLMQTWLKSLSLEECLALKIDNDRHWLKLHEIRGDKALIQKLSTNVAKDRAISADLGL